MDGSCLPPHNAGMMLLALALAVALQASSAAPTAGTTPPALPAVDTVNSTNFSFFSTRLRAVRDDVRIEGTVCRRANRSLISPTRVQIDHTPGSDDPIETSYAYLPRISQREDQRCGHFGTKLKTPPQPGDTFRVCLPQSKGACPVGK